MQWDKNLEGEKLHSKFQTKFQEFSSRKDSPGNVFGIIMNIK